MGHGADLEPLDTVEVTGIAGMDRNVFSEGRSGDQRVVGPGRRLSASRPQRRRNPTECPGGFGPKWNRLEIGLSLLQVRLTRGAFSGRPGDMWSDGQLSERDGADN